MSTQAYALRADHEDFVGGQLAWGPSQQTFDIGEELTNHGGVIVVEVDPDNPMPNQLLVDALDAYPALKHLPAKEAESRLAEFEASKPLPEGWRDLNKDELVELAGKRRIDATGTKEEIVKRLAAKEPAPAEQKAQHASEELTQEILESMTPTDLVKIAGEQGVQTKSADKPGDIVSRILDKQKGGSTG